MDVNARDSRGRTAVFIAAQQGHLETLKMLVNCNRFKPPRALPDCSLASLASYDAVGGPGVRGRTPLMTAAAKNLDCVRMLMDLSDFNAVDENGWGVGHYAASVGAVSTLELFVASGVALGGVSTAYSKQPIPNTTNFRNFTQIGFSALHTVMRYAEPPLNPFLQSIRVLVRHVDVNLADARGWTALHWACYRGLPELVLTLVEACQEAKVELDFLARATVKVSTRIPLPLTEFSDLDDVLDAHYQQRVDTQAGTAADKDSNPSHAMAIGLTGSTSFHETKAMYTNSSLSSRSQVDHVTSGSESGGAGESQPQPQPPTLPEPIAEVAEISTDSPNNLNNPQITDSTEDTDSPVQASESTDAENPQNNPDNPDNPDSPEHPEGVMEKAEKSENIIVPGVGSEKHVNNSNNKQSSSNGTLNSGGSSWFGLFSGNTPNTPQLDRNFSLASKYSNSDSLSYNTHLPPKHSGNSQTVSDPAEGEGGKEKKTLLVEFPVGSTASGMAGVRRDYVSVSNPYNPNSPNSSLKLV